MNSYQTQYPSGFLWKRRNIDFNFTNPPWKVSDRDNFLALVNLLQTNFSKKKLLKQSFRFSQVIVMLMAFWSNFVEALGPVTVDGQANIFASGGNADPLTCDPKNPPTCPPLAPLFDGKPSVGIPLPAQTSDRVLMFPSITGQVICDKDKTPKYVGAEGFALGEGCLPLAGGGTKVGIGTGPNFSEPFIGGLNGISAVTHSQRGQFLAGVFLDDPQPLPPAPPPIPDLATTQNDEYLSAPQLRQVFFIGDGLTGTGTIQKFYIPATATRLFLGFADSSGFQGSPSFYRDNGGALTVNYEFNTVPEAKHVRIDLNSSDTPNFTVGETLQGRYTYSDLENDIEGTSLLQWYTANEAECATKTAIAGATTSTYLVTSNEVGRYLCFEVTPVAGRGYSPGLPILTASYRPVSFLPETVNLTIKFGGQGQGKVSSHPEGINCESRDQSCHHAFNTGTLIILTPSPLPGSSFLGWAEEDCFSSLSLTYPMTCTALFDLSSTTNLTPSHTLPSISTIGIRVDGTGEGKIISREGKIDCTKIGSEKCQATYDTGIFLTLIPVPAPGSYFSSWGGHGDCVDNQVQLLGSMLCVGYFRKLPELMISKAGTGEGTVTAKGIDCGKDCVEIYQPNTLVTLNAIPTTNSQFRAWSGGCTGSSSLITVTLDAAKQCTATFDKLPPVVNIDIYTFTVEVGNTATFRASVTESPKTIQWNFGDGHTANTLSTFHTYQSVGSYPVILSVTDDQGNVVTKTVKVEVTSAKTFPEQLDLRKETMVSPSSDQLAAEQTLLRQSNDLFITYDKATGVLSSIYHLNGYLSDPAPGNHRDIALRYLNSHLDLLGLSQADIADMELTDQVYSKVTGATHLYWRQVYQQLPLYNTQLQVNVNREGRIISVNNSFIHHNISALMDTLQPILTAGEATKSAMQHLGIHMDAPAQETQAPSGIRQETILDQSVVALKPIQASLMLLPMQANEMRLVWNLIIYTLDEWHVYDINVDASNGEILTRFDWVDEEGETYKVYPLPIESPQHTHPLPPEDARETLILPHLPVTTPFESPLASPFGWHDIDGQPGAEYTITRGNNVYAHASWAGDTDCGIDLKCIFPFDLSQHPKTYVHASVSNLFYWNNIVHDVMSHYGFDSPAGNFQVNTYGEEGVGGDALEAWVQETWLTCNAGIFTPPEGSSPVVYMFLCPLSSGEIRDAALDDGVIVHEYGHGISNRLVGGPSNVSCLRNAQQPGEGISDWLGLVFTHQEGDTGAKKRGLGSYLFGLAPDGTIRPQPYSTDPTINTYTYESIKGLWVPHGTGSVWAQALWEVYWALVDQYGFGPNLYDTQGGKGNQRMLLYFTEGLKNTKCSPTFTDTRDGIIQAAIDNYEGEDVCLIWEAFAKFGLGTDAVSGGPNSLQPTNGFKFPQACINACNSPTVYSKTNGRWFKDRKTIWSTRTVPGPEDWVRVDHQITVDRNNIKVNRLCIEKEGVLQQVYNTTINAYPSPLTNLTGEIYNQGKILGQDGQNANSSSNQDDQGKPGIRINLRTERFVNTSTGKIQAGRGGDDIDYFNENVAKGGKGGSISIKTEHAFVNYGRIGPDPSHKELVKTHYALCQGHNYDYYHDVLDHPFDSMGGNGGMGSKWNGVFWNEGIESVQGAYGKAYGGNGGSVTIRGPSIENIGRIAAGYGGDAHRYDCSSPLRPGQGGDVVIIPVKPGKIISSGIIEGGEDGNIWIEPNILVNGQEVHLYNSKNITIFGGENTTLALNHLRSEALSATDTLTIAVGEGSVVDLRDNATKVLKAGVKAILFADTILLDEGVTLQDIIDAPNIETYPNKILYHVTLQSPEEMEGVAGETLSLDIVLNNAGPTSDTYTLVVTDSSGWPLGTFPGMMSVEGLQQAELKLEVTLPDTLGATDVITVTATSQSDPNVHAITEMNVFVDGESTVSSGNTIPTDSGTFETSEEKNKASGQLVDGEPTVQSDNTIPTDSVPAETTEDSEEKNKASGQLLDEQNQPVADAMVQINSKITTTDATGYWEITDLPKGQQTVTISKEGYILRQDLTVGDDLSVKVVFDLMDIPNTSLCPRTGTIDFICHNHGQVITDATFESHAKVTGGELAGTLTNRGFISSITLQPGSVLMGGTLSGDITNQGLLTDIEFIGHTIMGGTLSGTLLNESQIGGTLIDVTFAPNAHLKGGKLQGKIQGDQAAPALLEDVRILKGSELSGVILGQGVIQEEDVTFKE